MLNFWDVYLQNWVMFKKLWKIIWANNSYLGRDHFKWILPNIPPKVICRESNANTPHWANPENHRNSTPQEFDIDQLKTFTIPKGKAAKILPSKHHFTGGDFLTFMEVIKALHFRLPKIHNESITNSTKSFSETTHHWTRQPTNRNAGFPHQHEGLHFPP